MGVTSIAVRSFGADIAAGRFFGADPAIDLTAYIDLGSVRFPPQREQDLQLWPMQASSVFSVIGQRGVQDACFRPRQVLDSAAFAQTDQFRPVEPYARVVDSYCLAMPLLNGAWAMIVLMRCAPHRPFEDALTAQIDRTRPAMARALVEGYRRDLQLAAGPAHHPPASPASGESHAGLRVHRTIDDLSLTEQQVLAMLVEGLTEKQIAERMGRSPHTTHVHVRNIYRKTGISSRRELREFAAGQPG